MKPQTKNALRVHLGLFLAEVICITAFAVELSRALSGNTLSWAYVFEWPILGVYGVYMWRKILHGDDADRASPPVSMPPSEEVDPRLTAYNDYLDRVHRRTGRDHTTEHED